jgi:hypothetical protein
LIEEEVTTAELVYCSRMLRRDQELGKNLRFKHPLSFFDFARWIYPLRELRVRLVESDFSSYELNKLIAEYPSLLKRSNFGVIRTTESGDKIFKFFRSQEAEIRSSMIRDSMKPFRASKPTPAEDRTGEVFADWKTLANEMIDKGNQKAVERTHVVAVTKSERLRAMSAKNYKPEEVTQ